MSMKLRLALGAATLLAATPALAQQCGGDFGAWKAGITQEAQAAGVGERGLAALRAADIDQRVLQRDRAQGVFSQSFNEFSARMINNYRLENCRRNLERYADVFARAEREFGVPGPVITAFWAMETDFGAVQGDFNTRNALVTLSHDCRRPELFRPQLIALIEMVQRGDLDPQTNTGAWAGEIGQVQMLPKDIIAFGVDGDGDGHESLKTSAPDAIMTAAKFIQHLGFKRGEPWIQEVTLPKELPFEKSGLGGTMTAGEWFALGVKPREGNTRFSSLAASLVLPQGRNGPAFIAYPNFNIYLEWNKSFIYTTSAAYFATRLMGAEPYLKGSPEQGLSADDMKGLQTKLQQRGHDVGEIDGILGSGTRVAIQKEQQRLGMAADGWATPALLNAL